MKAETLRAMLDRVAKPKGSTYVLRDGETLALLIAAEGQDYSLSRVGSVELCEGFIEAKTSRQERILLDIDSVVGIRVSEKQSEAAGAGFFNR